MTLTATERTRILSRTRRDGAHLFKSCGSDATKVYRGGKPLNLSHRQAVYIALTGELPVGTLISACGMRGCIEPQHLRSVRSHREMCAFWKRRGSYVGNGQRDFSPPPGNKNASKLSWEQVQYIRENYPGRESLADLSARMGVTKAQIWRVARRKNWTKMPDLSRMRP